MARKAETTVFPDAVTRETSLPSADTSLQIQIPPSDAAVVDQGGPVQVWMPPERAPGIRAFGSYVPGTIYRVTPAEALRLVTAKRFRFAGTADQAAVSDHIDGIADAISTPKE